MAKQAFDNLAGAFELAGANTALSVAKDRKIEVLEARLVKKDGVTAWVAEEHSKLKRSLGEP